MIRAGSGFVFLLNMLEHPCRNSAHQESLSFVKIKKSFFGMVLLVLGKALRWRLCLHCEQGPKYTGDISSPLAAEASLP